MIIALRPNSLSYTCTYRTCSSPTTHQDIPMERKNIESLRKMHSISEGIFQENSFNLGRNLSGKFIQSRKESFRKTPSISEGIVQDNFKSRKRG